MRISDWSSDVCSSDLSDVRAAYDLGTLSTNLMTVNHTGGTQTDGVDTLRNVERLQFADQTVEINPAASCNEPATGTVTISDTTQIGRASCRESVCQDV